MQSNTTSNEHSVLGVMGLLPKAGDCARPRPWQPIISSHLVNAAGFFTALEWDQRYLSPSPHRTTLRVTLQE